jgi:hypothetical protein
VTAAVAVVLAVAFAAALAAAAAAGRRLLRWRRLQRRLACASAEVAAAMADGRLARATGEALLQHLEGLRRERGAARRS